MKLNGAYLWSFFLIAQSCGLTAHTWLYQGLCVVDPRNHQNTVLLSAKCYKDFFKIQKKKRGIRCPNKKFNLLFSKKNNGFMMW